MKLKKAGQREMLFMGIDVGTQGARCVVVDEAGKLAAAHSVPFESLNVSKTDGWYEQPPDAWVEAVERAVQVCTSQLGCPESIDAVSVDGTSGTILALDSSMRPLTNGIMYNDTRAKGQVQRVRDAMSGIEAKLGYRFGSSFSLPRMLWLKEERPEVWERTRLIVHQADYITGMLCGEYGASDDSNALKSGYDLIEGCWPEAIESKLGIETEKLPRVVHPGERIARVSATASARLGLPTSAWVVGGSTDGYASALAAGAVAPGRQASILGTTLVLKGVTRKLIVDPDGSAYSHRLPDGAWLLGGAANLGGRALDLVRGGHTYEEMDAQAQGLIPTGVHCYPLTGRGERFPFVKGDCEAFYLGELRAETLYPAVMEGVAFAERMALEHMDRLGCEAGDTIYTAGGACRSELWLRIRASVLNRQLRLPEVAEAAMGSALLAAISRCGSLERAAGTMLRCKTSIDPDPTLVKPYQELYSRFLEDVRRIYGVQP